MLLCVIILIARLCNLFKGFSIALDALPQLLMQ